MNIACAQGRYNIQHYTNDNGLPANGIKGIELDKKTGYLWVGTQAGLVRFDGMHFKSFGADKGKTAGSRILIVGRDEDATIYCGDSNSSIYQIVNNTPRIVAVDSVFMNPYIFWGGASWDEAVKYIIEEFKHYKRFPLLTNWAVYNNRPGNSKNFAFIYLGRACYYDVTKDTLSHFSAYQDFQQLLKVDGHTYYIRDNLDVWEYNDSIGKFVPVKNPQMPTWNGKGEKPVFIWQLGMKKTFLAHKRSIWEVHRNGNKFSLHPFCQECYPDDAHINAIQIWGEQGLIFLSSIVKGLYVVRKPFFNFISTDIVNINKTGRAEYAQAEIKPGAITTSSGRSFLFNGELLPERTTREFHAYTIYKDKKGEYWFHSGDTIIHFRPKINQYTKLPLNDRTLRMFYAETKDRFYVVSNFSIGEINEDRFQQKYSLPASDSLRHSLHPDAVIEWKPGVLAIAAERILLFDTEKAIFTDTISIPGLRSKIRSLLKYQDYLLVGTYGEGFYIYKNGISKKMPLDRKEYLSFVHCFKIDERGFCWMSTNHGLFKVSLKTLITAYEKGLDEIYYHYFGKDDGLPNTEFNGGCQPCMMELSNRTFSFPNMSGFTIFDPRKEHVPPPSGQVFIDEILADSLIYHPKDKELNNLPYSIKNLRFKISLPYFGNMENVYFSYKLDPYHDTWEQQDITQNNTLYFGQLKPGKYKLYLRVRNGFEADQYKVTAVNFRVLAPWYQSEWFYIVCVFAIAGLFWGLLKWRTARIERRKQELQLLVTQQTEDIAIQSKQLGNQLDQLQTQQTKLEEDNKIKSRLISIISHDMISPLKFMGYLGKMTLDDTRLSDEARRAVGYMATVAQDMESLTINLLNWIRFHHESLEMEPEKFDLYTLVKESVEIVVTLAQQKEIGLIIDISEGVEVGQFRQAIGVIVYNLAMNAVKHTNTGEIRIAGSFSSDHFTISVADTGPGIQAETVEQLNDPDFFDFNYASADSKKYQFGYIIIKDLLRLSNGHMKVESVLTKGTTVTLYFRNAGDDKAKEVPKDKPSIQVRQS